MSNQKLEISLCIFFFCLCSTSSSSLDAENHKVLKDGFINPDVSRKYTDGTKHISPLVHDVDDHTNPNSYPDTRGALNNLHPYENHKIDYVIHRDVTATGRKLRSISGKIKITNIKSSTKQDDFKKSSAKENTKGYSPTLISAEAFLLKKRGEMYKRFLLTIRLCLALQVKMKLLSPKEEELGRKAFTSMETALAKDPFSRLIHYSNTPTDSSSSISPGAVGVLKEKMGLAGETMDKAFNEGIVKLVRIGLNHFYVKGTDHKPNVKLIKETVEKLRLLPKQYGHYLTKVVEHVKHCVHLHEMSGNQEQVFRNKLSEIIENLDGDMRELLQDFKATKSHALPSTFTRVQIQKLQFARRHADMSLRHIRNLIAQLTKERDSLIRAYLPEIDAFDIASYNRQNQLKQLQKKVDEEREMVEQQTFREKRSPQDENLATNSRLGFRDKNFLQRGDKTFAQKVKLIKIQKRDILKDINKLGRLLKKRSEPSDLNVEELDMAQEDVSKQTWEDENLENNKDEISNSRIARSFINLTMKGNIFVYLGIAAGIIISIATAITVYMLVKKNRVVDDVLSLYGNYDGSQQINSMKCTDFDDAERFKSMKCTYYDDAERFKSMKSHYNKHRLASDHCTGEHSTLLHNSPRQHTDLSRHNTRRDGKRMSKVYH